MLQEVHHSTVHIIGIFRRGTHHPRFPTHHPTSRRIPILTILRHVTGMPLPMPQPLHGSIRPSLQIIRQPNHEGTSGDGCRRTRSGWVGCHASVSDSLARGNEENGSGGSEHCSIRISITHGIQYQRHDMSRSCAKPHGGESVRGIFALPSRGRAQVSI